MSEGRVAAGKASVRTQVIDALRRLGSASRQELVVATGISRATLVKLLPDLLESGLVVETATGGPQRAGRTGRRPGALAVNPQAGAIVCVAFRGESIEVGIANMAAELEFVARQPMNTPFTSTTEAFDRAAAMVDETITASGVDRARLLAVGLSVPAPIDRRTGAVTTKGILRNWNATSPADEMRARVPLPVLVDNDANLAALAELRFGAGRGCDDFIYVLVAGGIGSALVLNGRLYRGATGLAGELAHTVTDPNGPLCRCGNRGCLDVSYDVRGQLAVLRPVIGEAIGIDDIVRLLHERDRATLGVVRDAGVAIGRVLAGYCNELNPSAMIFGGPLASPESPLLEGVRQAIDRFALNAIADQVELIRGSFGPTGELIGVALMVAGSLDVVPSSRIVELHRAAGRRSDSQDASAVA